METVREDEEKVIALAGLERVKGSSSSPLPEFLHGASGMRFVRVPGGRFIMGWRGDELRAAFEKVGFDPGIEFWAQAHRARYVAANPPRVVSVQPFLCACSPLTGDAVDGLSAGVQWSTHETAERKIGSTAAAMTARDVVEVMKRHGWDLISEAQWEYVARCGGDESWAGGERFQNAVTLLQNDPSFNPGDDDTEQGRNRWGIWGLPLGEWVSDEWHENYEGAPEDARPWRSGNGVPSITRGGGVLHYPWQDSDEAISSHAAYRSGDGGWRGMFTARPVIQLPARELGGDAPLVPKSVPFEVIADNWARECEAKRRRQIEAQNELVERTKKLATDLPGSVQEGTVRSVSDGVAIITLPEANGILRSKEAATLVVGERVTVRVEGSGRVPEVALLHRHSGST